MDEMQSACPGCLAEPPLARPTGSAFVVIAHRWGLRDAHSYCVGCYSTKRDAIKAATLHVQYRGGKYGCEVIACRGAMDEGGTNALKQVGYVESPYYGLGGQNRPACQPADKNKIIAADMAALKKTKPALMRKIKRILSRPNAELSDGAGEKR